MDSEWINGLPPVGCECEMANPMSGKFDLVEVLAHKCEWVVYWDGESAGKAGSNWFRPIRTKAERDREELERILADHRAKTVEVCAESIIKAGWQKPE